MHQAALLRYLNLLGNGGRMVLAFNARSGIVNVIIILQRTVNSSP